MRTIFDDLASRLRGRLSQAAYEVAPELNFAARVHFVDEMLLSLSLDDALAILK